MSGAPEAAPSAQATRGARRRAATRARLLAAAQATFARHGVDATRVQDITEEADVGFGSFYNHFDDKDAIVAAVLEELAGRQSAGMAVLREVVADPAEVVSVAHRHFLRLAVADPTWAWLLIRLDVTHRALERTLGPQAHEDVRRGVDAGRFHVGDPVLAANAMGALLLGTTRVVLEGRLDVGPHPAVDHAALVLRMLGLPPEEAAEIAARPLPGA
jgi:AcrR family transcriptional regulator